MQKRTKRIWNICNKSLNTASRNRYVSVHLPFRDNKMCPLHRDWRFVLLCIQDVSDWNSRRHWVLQEQAEGAPRTGDLILRGRKGRGVWINRQRGCRIWVRTPDCHCTYRFVHRTATTCTTSYTGLPLHLPVRTPNCHYMHHFVHWTVTACTTPYIGLSLHAPLCTPDCHYMHHSVHWTATACTTPYTGMPVHEPVRRPSIRQQDQRQDTSDIQYKILHWLRGTEE
jgi:hypothetical protein